MNAWMQRWQALSAREQWLSSLAVLAVLAVLYVLLLGDPLTQRVAAREAAIRTTQGHIEDAASQVAELQARLAADPNIPYRSSLLAASATREEMLQRIDNSTAGLISPDRMRSVLERLLRAQPGLKLMGMQSFTEPVSLPPSPDAAKTKNQPEAETPLPVLYRHGLVLELEGGYFDLVRYLQAVQQSGWRLNWDSLDYQVGEAGPRRAKITLKLFTLSRKAGWVGV